MTAGSIDREMTPAEKAEARRYRLLFYEGRVGREPWRLHSTAVQSELVKRTLNVGVKTPMWLYINDLGRV